MQKLLLGAFFTASLASFNATAQKIVFSEYDLPNGLHVILHADHHAPVVAVSVMYHVGAKNEVVGRTGFAHFFEHLLFEGTENIKRGQFMKVVSANGGTNNANTTQDRTFYYEVFPSNYLETGLWLESERMLHPVINEIGVKTQSEVVKEERRLRVDNRPYGSLFDVISRDLFPVHPYHNGVIGQMHDIDAAKLEEFQAFFKQYYVPNNAVLTVTGDIDVPTAKQSIAAYFGPVPIGAPVAYHKTKEAPLTKKIIDTVYDANIQLPLIGEAYRVPGRNTRDAKIMQVISSILSAGSSSRLYKKMVDDKKDALQVLAFNYPLEDYGMYITGAIPNNGAKPAELLNDFHEEVRKLQTDLITQEEYEKLQNQLETTLLNANSQQLSIAENLANGYTFYHKDTNEINEELNVFHSISREEIRDAARRYLDMDRNLVLYYLPGKGQGSKK